jgi:hypothetical protein
VVDAHVRRGRAAEVGERYRPAGSTRGRPKGWAERSAERSPAVPAWGERGLLHATVIIETASRLITEKGSEFTTQELVKEAGVSLQTFYRYFPSKDQLILAVLER